MRIILCYVCLSVCLGDLGNTTETPEGDQQEHQRHNSRGKRDQTKKPQVPAKEFDGNKLLVLKAALEIVTNLLKLIRELIEWLDKQVKPQLHSNINTREKLDVIIHKLSGILLTLFDWCDMYLRIIFK